MGATWERWARALVNAVCLQVILLKLALFWPALDDLFRVSLHSTIVLAFVWALQKTEEDGLAKTVVALAVGKNWTSIALASLSLLMLLITPVAVDCEVEGNLEIAGRPLHCRAGERESKVVLGLSRSVQARAREYQLVRRVSALSPTVIRFPGDFELPPHVLVGLSRLTPGINARARVKVAVTDAQALYKICFGCQEYDDRKARGLFVDGFVLGTAAAEKSLLAEYRALMNESDELEPVHVPGVQVLPLEPIVARLARRTPGDAASSYVPCKGRASYEPTLKGKNLWKLDVEQLCSE